MSIPKCSKADIQIDKIRDLTGLCVIFYLDLGTGSVLSMFISYQNSLLKRVTKTFTGP